jgi:signal transduction histidine kinase
MSWIRANSLSIALLTVELLLLARCRRVFPFRALPGILVALASLAVLTARLVSPAVEVPVALTVLLGVEQAVSAFARRRARRLWRITIRCLVLVFAVAAALGPSRLLLMTYGGIAAGVVAATTLARMRRARLAWTAGSWWTMAVAVVVWALSVPASVMWETAGLIPALAAAHSAALVTLSDRGRSRRTAKSTSPSVATRLAVLERDLASQQGLATAGVLAAGAVHEIRNLLSNIQTGAEWGLRAQDVRKKDDALGLIMRNVREGLSGSSRLLKDLSAVGREEPSRVAAADVLAKAVDTIRASVALPSTLSLQSVAPRDGFFDVRSGEIHQVLIVLLRNSVQAALGCGHPCRIRLQARFVGSEVEIEVSDNAGGIASALRADSVARMGDLAAGSLGLRLASRIAELNGGGLDHISTGEGTVFRLIVPRAITSGRDAASDRRKPDDPD